MTIADDHIERAHELAEMMTLPEVQPELCGPCGRERVLGQPDPCLGLLPGVAAACCGHGLDRGYVLFENGIRVTLRRLKRDSEDIPAPYWPFIDEFLR